MRQNTINQGWNKVSSFDGLDVNINISAYEFLKMSLLKTNPWHFPRNHENNKGDTSFYIWKKGTINILLADFQTFAFL